MSLDSDFVAQYFNRFSHYLWGDALLLTGDKSRKAFFRTICRRNEFRKILSPHGEHEVGGDQDLSLTIVALGKEGIDHVHLVLRLAGVAGIIADDRSAIRLADDRIQWGTGLLRGDAAAGYPVERPAALKL